MLKSILIFAAGAAAGAIGSFFITRHVVKSKVLAKANAEMQKSIDDIKEHYTVPKDYGPKLSPERMQKRVEETLKKSDGLDAKYNSKEEAAKRVQIKYAASAFKPVKEPHLDYVTEKEAQDFIAYEEVELHLWKNGVITNQFDDEVIEHPQLLVGSDISSMIGVQGDENMIAVLNHDTNQAFIVKAVNDTWDFPQKKEGDS